MKLKRLRAEALEAADMTHMVRLGNRIDLWSNRIDM